MISRRLLTRLRDTMATQRVSLAEVTRLIASEVAADVCSIYVLRAGDVLELLATYGLRPDSVGRTRLRVGEGIIGIAAATGAIQNLADATTHPDFAYRPDTGEDDFTSLLAVPVRRGGRTKGVLTLQTRVPHRYSADEVDLVETACMLLAEALGETGMMPSADDGLGATLPRRFEAAMLAPGIAIGPAIASGFGTTQKPALAPDPAPELHRLDHALAAMRTDLDSLIEQGMPDSEESREILEATRLVAADDGWVRRVKIAIDGGLTAEAAVTRVASDIRDRMRRITDPYLRERLADLEDLAGRLLQALDGSAPAGPVPHGGGAGGAPARPGPIAAMARPRHRRRGDRGRQPVGPRRDPGPGAGHCRSRRRARRAGRDAARRRRGAGCRRRARCAAARDGGARRLHPRPRRA